MSETTIEWTRGPQGEQGYSFNPWLGCSKISPACDFCYAESWAKRAGWPELWNGERRRTRAENWRQPLKWDREAAAAGGRRRVFCASLADVFDNQVPPVWRADLFELIKQTPRLDWLLLTKRIGNAEGMIKAALFDGDLLSPENMWPWPNVWIGATVCNQEEAERDIPKLMQTPARIRFVSCEPLLGPIDFARVPGFNKAGSAGMDLLRNFWVIAGGESGSRARPSHPDWFRSLRDQCAAASVPFHFKQWGCWAPGECAPGPQVRTEQVATWWGGEWHFGRQTPAEGAECHRDDEPDLYHFGKKAAGRLLDGREWNDSPRRKR